MLYETSQHLGTVDYLLKESGLTLDDGEETGSFALVLNSVNDRLETQDVSQAAKVDSEV